MGTRTARAGESGLVVENVSMTLGGATVLEDVRFRVARGERVALVGPNGSGKSTLLRCLYGWRRQTAGSVRLDGREVADLPDADRASRIAVLMQEGEFGSAMTVAEVVALGRLPHRGSWSAESAGDRERVGQALAAVRLTGLGGRAFSSLSGGEKQRVLLARALAQEPELLILDEPTNHLDIRHQLGLLSLVAQGASTVVAALHDLTLAARWCDRVVLLDAGRVAGVGAPAEVLTAERVGRVYGVDVVVGADERTGRPRLDFYPAQEGGA